MDTERPLRVGIVGCGAAALGRWGHIPALKKIRAANLAAVCDLNENLAKKVAKKFHIDRYYAELSEMLKDEDKPAQSLDAHCLSALQNQHYHSQVLAKSVDKVAKPISYITLKRYASPNKHISYKRRVGYSPIQPQWTWADGISLPFIYIMTDN